MKNSKLFFTSLIFGLTMGFHGSVHSKGWTPPWTMIIFNNAYLAPDSSTTEVQIQVDNTDLRVVDDSRTGIVRLTGTFDFTVSHPDTVQKSVVSIDIDQELRSIHIWGEDAYTQNSFTISGTDTYTDINGNTTVRTIKSSISNWGDWYATVPWISKTGQSRFPDELGIRFEGGPEHFDGTFWGRYIEFNLIRR